MKKKISLLLLILLLVTSCGTKQTDYELFIKQNEDVSQASNFLIKYDLIVDSVEYSYQIAVDFETKTIMVQTNDLLAYVFEDYAYLYDNDQWVKSNLYNFNYFEIEKLLSNSYYQLNFPKEDEAISNLNTGIKELDTLLNGATPNDLVVALDDNLFSFIGLENNLKINTTGSQIILSYTNPSINEQVTVTYAIDLDSVYVPDEAVDAIEVDGNYDLSLSLALEE